jgi:hypothetical protein
VGRRPDSAAAAAEAVAEAVAEAGDAVAVKRQSGFLRLLRALGPGFVSGASDNDPTTVATVAVVGSTTVYALGWARRNLRSGCR